MGSTSGLRGPMRSMNVLEVSLMIKITAPFGLCQISCQMLCMELIQ